MTTHKFLMHICVHVYIQRAIISVKYIYTGTIRVYIRTICHTVVMSHVDSTRCVATIYIIDLHTLNSFCADKLIATYVNTVHITTDGIAHRMLHRD